MRPTGPGLASASVSHTYNVAGYYSVSLAVSNGSLEYAATTNANMIRVAPSQLFVATNGANVIPFDTWSKAATNILSTVAQTMAGSVVNISNGTYRITNQVHLLQGVGLVGVNGPANTTIARDPAAGNFRILYMIDPNAVVAGLTLQGGQFTGSSDSGAGVLMSAGLVSNCVIQACTNTSTGGGNLGGAIYASGGLIVSSTVARCSGGRGVIDLEGGVIRDSVICSNTPWTDGGIMLRSVAIRCRIFANSNSTSSVSSGGGARVDSANSIMTNCLIYGNYTSDSSGGGGIYLSAGRVINCTIANNTSGGSGSVGAGVYQDVGGAITNCIIYFNTGPLGEDDYKTNGAGLAEGYCCAPELTGGGNNLSAAPQFANAANHDYHLRATSPCVDAGTNLPGLVDDIDRTPRPFDGNRDGRAIVDMGAYEMVNPLARGTIIMVR